MRRCVGLFIIALLASVSATPASSHGAVRISAEAGGRAIAKTQRSLIGVGWDGAAFTADVMKDLRPNLVRIDASFENLYHRGRKIDEAVYTALETDVREALAIGGEPVVILAYTPVWLADTTRPHTDATRVPPSDPDVWQRLVVEVVTRLSALGARTFEAWNEPDFPVFFQGLPNEYLQDVFRPSALAILEVEKGTRRDLRFGGCACSLPDVPFIAGMIQYARSNDLPLDFISWHHYGNSPLLGPDGTEPIGPPEARVLLGPIHQRNPVTTPSQFGDHIAAVRAVRDALYRDGAPKPELWIDEWNLSSGGFDMRHDGTAGAAYQAGVLAEFQRAGLDRAAIFRSVDPAYGTDVIPPSPELYGGWGLVGRKGTFKPAWWVHRSWRALGGDVLAYGSRADTRLGVEAVVTRAHEGSFVSLVSNFHATAEHGHRVEIVLEDAGTRSWSVRVVRPDGSDRRSDVRSRGSLVVPVDLVSQDVALVYISTKSK